MQKFIKSFNPLQSPHCNGGKFCILMRPITLRLTPFSNALGKGWGWG